MAATRASLGVDTPRSPEREPVTGAAPLQAGVTVRSSRPGRALTATELTLDAAAGAGRDSLVDALLAAGAWGGATGCDRPTARPAATDAAAPAGRESLVDTSPAAGASGGATGCDRPTARPAAT